MRHHIDRRLVHLGNIITQTIVLPGCGERLKMTRPASLEDLLDLSAGDPELNLPYWVEPWPSGIALADAITLHPEMVAGKRVFELGCGLGVTAIAALRAGADLVVSDYSADALLLATINATANAAGSLATLQLNWRDPASQQRILSDGAYPVVLAADVLYESRDVEPLLTLIEAILTPNGVLYLAEPGRPIAQRFLDVAHAHGWISSCQHHQGPWPEAKDAGVIVRIHALRRP